MSERELRELRERVVLAAIGAGWPAEAVRAAAPELVAFVLGGDAAPADPDRRPIGGPPLPPGVTFSAEWLDSRLSLPRPPGDRGTASAPAAVDPTDHRTWPGRGDVSRLGLATWSLRSYLAGTIDRHRKGIQSLENVLAHLAHVRADEAATAASAATAPTPAPGP